MAHTRVTRICDAAADTRTLRLQLLEVLRELIGFDAYAWLLTDPETTVGCAPIADVPCLPELPRAIRLKYLTQVNRWTALHDPPVGLLHQATGGDLSRSPMWHELLRDYGITDIASVVFRDGYGCWGFLDLWRTGAVFTDENAALLAELAPVVTAALRRCQANTFIERVAREQRLEPIVLLLSPELAVRQQTPRTQEYLSQLVPPEGGSAPVPAGAYNVAAQLLAVEAGVDGHPPAARVYLADGVWVTLRAAKMGSSDIVVSIEECTPAERISLYARAFGLTAREAELLGELATGADTRELARRLFLSEHTVQDHLKSIFAKTEARSRRTLLSRALGT